MKPKQPKIWVVGEALIDLLPRDGGTVPVVGGGAANTAKALANLNLEVSWIGGISTDKYGDLIRDELKDVDLSLALQSGLPTALARVSLDESGSASYEFSLHGTATFEFNENWLPRQRPELIHVGTLATIIEPGAKALHEWISDLDIEVIFDPNVRPTVLPDRDEYREAFKKWAKISSVIKMSEEDFDYLSFEIDEILSFGPKLLVLTLGVSGISGYTKNAKVSVPSVAVDVVDTVGAGDTVGAIVAEGILRYGLNELIDLRLKEVLERAAKAAAITCSRAGAKPPLLSELI